MRRRIRQLCLYSSPQTLENRHSSQVALKASLGNLYRVSTVEMLKLFVPYSLPPTAEPSGWSVMDTLHELDSDGEVVLVVNIDKTEFWDTPWPKRKGKRGKRGKGSKKRISWPSPLMWETENEPEEATPEEPAPAPAPAPEAPPEAPPEEPVLEEPVLELLAPEEPVFEEPVLEVPAPEAPAPEEALEPATENNAPVEKCPSPKEERLPEEPAINEKAHGESSYDTWGPKVRMRVSSSHLRLASPYFKRMFRSGWLEGDALRVEGRVEIRLQNGENPDALLVVLNIIHGHTRRVPQVVDLTMLTKIAVLVDFYECYEAVEVFSNMWIDSLKGDLPQSISTNLTQWIWVTWVFNKPELFKAVTRIAGRQNKDPIETEGLPIPQIVVERIDQQRQESIGRIISALNDLLDHFKSETMHCSFECDSILLGALTKEMESKKLSSQHLRAPFLGLSYEDVVDKVKNIRPPNWSGTYSRHYYRHECNIETHVNPIIASLDDYMCGLDLKDFPSLQGRDA